MLFPALFNNNFLDDDWFDFSFPTVERDRKASRPHDLMKTDVRESDTGYEVAIELPGYAKEDLQVELEDGKLTVSAAHSAEKDEKDKKGRYIRRERFYGNVSRSFYVGKDLTREDIHAKFENGVLTLDVPKKQPVEQPKEQKQITIE